MSENLSLDAGCTLYLSCKSHWFKSLKSNFEWWYWKTGRNVHHNPLLTQLVGRRGGGGLHSLRWLLRLRAWCWLASGLRGSIWCRSPLQTEAVLNSEPLLIKPVTAGWAWEIQAGREGGGQVVHGHRDDCRGGALEEHGGQWLGHFN